jgi:lipopolysaccharide transport system permease protein
MKPRSVKPTPIPSRHSRVRAIQESLPLTNGTPEMHTPIDAVNPHAAPLTSLASAARGLWRDRQLIAQMTRREIVGRYQGSFMGLAWAFFNPVFILVAYFFVFAVVFQARWGGEAEASRGQFALLLLVGVVVHGLFSEVLTRAPGLILANANFVKKVVFPLEVLPAVATAAALFHAIVTILVLVIGSVVLNGHVPWTVVLIPLVFLPFMLFTLGLAWILASLGVFFRDAGQITGMLAMILLFLSPVFYPISAVPEQFQGWMLANPLTFVIEQARQVLIWGHMPNWTGLCVYAAGALLVAWAGYAWFQKTRRGFADVM